MNPGGGGGGRGGNNYGPSSPPTGSLPPFYESLKGGNQGAPGFNGQGLGNGVPFGGVGALTMDCDTGQELYAPQKQYSLLQNASASYGFVFKDEDDLVGFKQDGNPLPPVHVLNGYNNGGGPPPPPQNGYEMPDAMMVDLVSGNVVDPLQFTATLTFSSQADHNALLDSLTDDLFLQRMSSPDDHLLDESLPNPVEPAVESFPQLVNRVGTTNGTTNGFDMSRNYPAPNTYGSAPGSGVVIKTEAGYNLPKERPELALHINSSRETNMDELQVNISFIYQ